MSPQAVPMLDECDDVVVSECEERQRRRGFLRTDMHTMYDFPLQNLQASSTGELRKIAKGEGGKYSSELRAEANSILRSREDPQDRDTIEADM
ncbi:MAG TPA: hypothetical protein VEC08_04925 [Nitrososphaerales archaeon]|nr:hypothetical protein [Nitrososphaerales archaeon]